MELGFPPFLAHLSPFFREIGYLAKYCSVLPQFCCNDILYCHVKMAQIGAVGGEIWQNGSEKWGSRCRQSGIGPPTGNFQAQVF